MNDLTLLRTILESWSAVQEAVARPLSIELKGLKITLSQKVAQVDRLFYSLGNHTLLRAWQSEADWQASENVLVRAIDEAKEALAAMKV